MKHIERRLQESRQRKDATKSELVYGDLCKLYRDINCFRRNPWLFRLAFESYIFKSQQLTEAMRSEYKRKTGLTWEASKFNDWNEFTAALKKIRNATMHGHPIMLNEAILSIYLTGAINFHGEELEPQGGDRKYIAIVVRSFLRDDFSEKTTVVDPVYRRKEIHCTNPNCLKKYAFPNKGFVFYEICWNLLDLSPLKEDKSGKQVDAVKLVLKSFPVLKAYMNVYRRELDLNLRDCYKPDYFVRLGDGMGSIINKKYRRKKP